MPGKFAVSAKVETRRDFACCNLCRGIQFQPALYGYIGGIALDIIQRQNAIRKTVIRRQRCGLLIVGWVRGLLS